MGSPAKKMKEMDEDNNKEDNFSKYADRDVISLADLDSANTRSVLIIEDDATSRLIIKRMAKKHFNKIHDFESVEEAVEALSKDNFDVDVLIADYFLPGGEPGSKMAHILKKKNSNTKTFIISGSVDEIENELKMHFVDDVLIKPFCYESLDDYFEDDAE